MDNKGLVDSSWNEIVDIRKELHRNPELCYKEFKTAEIIKNALKRNNIDYEDNICTTGIAGLIKGCKDGKTVALRADMDGLPVTEKTGVDFASVNHGFMHACGHDAHMSMVLGAGIVLNKLKENLNGNVKLIFQPAEEQGITGGAKQMIREGVLDSPKVDYVFGMHVWPDVEGGKIGVKTGPLMACCDHWKLKLTGKGGHISMPHKCNNPIYAAAQFINSVAGLRTQSIDPFEDVIVDIGSMNTINGLGNIIPDEVHFAGNTRSYNNELRKHIKEKLVKILEGIKISYGIDYELDYNFGYSPVNNHKDAVEIFKKAAAQVVSEENIIDVHPVMAAEDFGEYLTETEGAFAWIGVKQDQYIPLHNSKFIADEETIKRGIEVYCQIVSDILLSR